MDNIRQKFSNKFQNHWIKVKFYKKEPKLKVVGIPKNLFKVFVG